MEYESPQKIKNIKRYLIKSIAFRGHVCVLVFIFFNFLSDSGLLSLWSFNYLVFITLRKNAASLHCYCYPRNEQTKRTGIVLTCNICRKLLIIAKILFQITILGYESGLQS